MKNKDLLKELNDARTECLTNDRGISIHQLLKIVNFKNEDLEDMFAFVKDWLAINRSQFNSAVQKYRVEMDLGRVPQTAMELVDLVAKRNQVSVTYKGILSKNVTPVDEKGQPITEERMKDKFVRNYVNAHFSRDYREDFFERDCRLFSADYKLGFPQYDIRDAVSAWMEKQKMAAKEIICASAAFPALSVSRVEAEKQWLLLATSSFDEEQQTPEFTVAVLKKFMWMIKRKMHGLEITNHIMPVLLGAQGCGKSTLIRKMLECVVDAVEYTDFGQITDDRHIDLWENFALVLDEMGYANRADWDIVKHLITATTVTRRPMHSNRNVRIKQNASFIGSSNKDIQQLITDETGNRRFVPLYCKHPMDFDVINSINFANLWATVDMDGRDPMEAVRAELASVQEEARAQSPVEIWSEMLPSGMFSNKTAATIVFEEYTEWEAKMFPKLRSTYRWFGAEMKRLIKQKPDFGWSDKRTNKAQMYWKV